MRVLGSTLWLRYALLLPTCCRIVGAEPLLRQLRLSVRPPEPRASYLAGWGFIIRDRAVTCEEHAKRNKVSMEKGEKPPNWGSGVVWH